MNKTSDKLPQKGKIIHITNPRFNFSFRGSWIAVQRNNTILDKFR